jgi:GNAT superfamily N-acetyltransferase
MEVKICKTAADILKCRDVVRELRPHIAAENFVATVQAMTEEGYQLAFIEEDGIAAAAIGFRYLQFLYNGKHIYIDDLSTLPSARARGYGGKLLGYVEATAREKGYTAVTLDSGHHRTNAHRLYLNKGYSISAHHFTKSLK